MINNFLFTIFSLVIGLIDYSNRKKIINYFKNKFQNQNLTIIDIGAHKGETIDFFFKYFSIDNIYAFEPNNELYNRLKQQKKYNKKNIYIYNCGVGEEEQIKSLNIMNDTFSSTFNSIIDIFSK